MTLHHEMDDEFLSDFPSPVAAGINSKIQQPATSNHMKKRQKVAILAASNNGTSSTQKVAMSRASSYHRRKPAKVIIRLPFPRNTTATDSVVNSCLLSTSEAKSTSSQKVAYPPPGEESFMGLARAAPDCMTTKTSDCGGTFRIKLMATKICSSSDTPTPSNQPANKKQNQKSFLQLNTNSKKVQ